MVEIKAFTMDELYELVSAEHSAIQMEDAGYHSGWYEFASEEEYGHKIRSLGKYEEKFEKDLRNTAKNVSENFEELENLCVEDFDTEEDFWEERKIIQEGIIGEIGYCLGSYLI